MGIGLLGTKLGMSRYFIGDGISVPVTVIRLGPCVVTQLRTPERDGYAAVQVGYDEVKPRNATMPMIAHDHKAGSGPLRHHREFRVSEGELGEYEVGQRLTAEHLAGQTFVDVTGTSKGKGFQGGMKRYGFKGQLATHGIERKHRSPGSIAGHASNSGQTGKVKKGKRMAGHMGDNRVTQRSLDVVSVDTERGLMLVKGPVPGSNKSLVTVRPSVRLYKGKAAQVAG